MGNYHVLTGRVQLGSWDMSTFFSAIFFMKRVWSMGKHPLQMKGPESGETSKSPDAFLGKNDLETWWVAEVGAQQDTCFSRLVKCPLLALLENLHQHDPTIHRASGVLY